MENMSDKNDSQEYWDNDAPFVEQPWDIIRKYYENQDSNRIVRHQLESYNHFLDYQISRTIEMFNPIIIRPNEDEYYNAEHGKWGLEISITLSNFCIIRPQINENNGAVKIMFPQEARVRDFSYSSQSMVDVNVTYNICNGPNMENKNTINRSFPKVPLGKIPIMLKSSACMLSQYDYIDSPHTGECSHDPGGYFIINGSEKTILGQERPAENIIYCFNVQKTTPKFMWNAEVKSVPPDTCISPKQISILLASKNNGFGFPIYIQLARLSATVPLFIMFRALGVLSDKEICELIILNIEHDDRKEMLDALQASIIDANNVLKKWVQLRVRDKYKGKIDNAERRLSTAVQELEEGKKDDVKEESENEDDSDDDEDGEGDEDDDVDESDCDGSDSDDEKESDGENDDVDDSKLNLKNITEQREQEVLEMSVNYFTQDNAVRYISDLISYIPRGVGGDPSPKINIKVRRYNFVSDIIKGDLFPHCDGIVKKKYYLGYMTNQLLQAYFGWIPSTDRDAYGNKRINSAGVSLNNLFRNNLNKLVRDMERQIVKEVDNGTWRSTENYYDIINQSNLPKIIKSSTIENAFKRALGTGDFGMKHMANSTKVGVAQVLARLTPPATLSHLRRISTPSDKNGKLVMPRKLHNTGWGFMCPAETPEGASVGIVKSLSYLVHLTINSDGSAIHEYLKDHVDYLEAFNSTAEMFNKVKVIINGVWVGIAKDPIVCHQYIKNLKYTGIISIYTSVVFDFPNLEIRVCSDAGRPTRPLMIVKDGKILMTNTIIQQLLRNELTWDDLFTNFKLKHAVLEYIDPAEQSFAMIASLPKNLNNKEIRYTHCEIHSNTIFGIVAACIPFPDHNQSPRNTYQCAQGKQAMGVYATNYAKRMDRTAYILNYPSRPLVDTRLMDFIKLNEIPSGCNINVAIMTHTGYNQEDSLLINKGAIDRGLFQVTVYHSEKDEDKQKNKGDEKIRRKPNKEVTRGMKMGANYDKIGPNGLMPENSLVENRDIIIGKFSQIKENKNNQNKHIKYEDSSKIHKTIEETYIDKNCVGKNGEGFSFCKVRLRAQRKPVIGDKFSSRHGQKGTGGNIIPEENMPYTLSGVRPDMIINPHAIPSRMTIGQLKESSLGKILVELGLFGDGTSFGDLSVDEISKMLLKMGHEAHGNELMYDGVTGEQIACPIFIGPVFYQRLKHMVTDKTHSRSFGPVVNLTRQPAEGRCRDGGLRFGEMERDCGISHGASRFTKERLCDVSDKYSTWVCDKCGMLAAVNPSEHIHMCNTCENTSSFSRLDLPYSCKLLFQELTTMNVIPRVVTKTSQMW